MAMTQITLASGRVGLKKYFTVELEKLDLEWQWLIGREDNTNQTFETYKQMAGLGPASQTDEDGSIDFDDMYPLFVNSFTPVMFTKGAQYSPQAQYTDQYNKFKGLQPAYARSFAARKNIVAANLHNLGFTDTTYGMNNETLYSTTHSMGAGAPVLSNKPATNLAFGPLAMRQAWAEIQNQKSARNLPMFPMGKLDLMLPMNLLLQGMEYVKTTRGFPGTNDNNINSLTPEFNVPKGCHYFTSTTAWFIKAADVNSHHLFLLQQMPYDVLQLARTNLMYSWAAYESYCVGWYDAHGTWGSPGS